MKIKDCKELRAIAKECNRTAEEVSEIIVENLTEAGIVCGDPIEWGSSLGELAKCADLTIKEVSTFISDLGVSRVQSRHIDMLSRMILLGDGDCPVCGGEMFIIDSDLERCGGDGYSTPYDYEVLSVDKRCPHCGCVIHDADI